ncbi:hypothetical protein BSFP_040140 [Burkholderia stabilis]|uniref:Uncharacterized protein n=1 Tax=Burkholderia stabilis TaxID=95485 RepID=A0A1Y1BUF2_9BURK|nr:hypothetical protein BSFP_040140 [Burkholderia stabilis]
MVSAGCQTTEQPGRFRRVGLVLVVVDRVGQRILRRHLM